MQVEQVVAFAALMLFLTILIRRKQSDPTETERTAFDKAWWVIVTTEKPNVEYFFGPFLSKADAVSHQSGYIKDLYDEGAINIRYKIRWCQPTIITNDLNRVSA